MKRNHRGLISGFLWQYRTVRWEKILWRHHEILVSYVRTNVPSQMSQRCQDSAKNVVYYLECVFEEDIIEIIQRDLAIYHDTLIIMHIMTPADYKNFIICLDSHYVPVDSENKLLSYCVITIYIINNPSNAPRPVGNELNHRFPGDSVYHLSGVKPLAVHWGFIANLVTIYIHIYIYIYIYISDILIKIQRFAFTKMNLKKLFARC